MKAVAKKTVPARAPAVAKVPVQIIIKTPVILYMPEQMEARPKQVAGFFNLLIETATTHTREERRVYDSGFGASWSKRNVQPGSVATRPRERRSRSRPRRS